MMEGEVIEQGRIEEVNKVKSSEVKSVLKKAWIWISIFMVGFGAPLLAITYLNTGGDLGATIMRFWAMSGMIFGFLLGIPIGMIILEKIAFNKSNL